MSAQSLQKQIKISLLSETSLVTPMDGFEHRVCDKDIVDDSVAQFILCLCFHSLALGRDQLLLQVIV